MKKTFYVLSLIAIFLMGGISSFSQSIVGKWKTIDDETNKPKSVVEIWKGSDGLYYGKIIKLFEKDKQNNKCTKCDKNDSRYNKKIVGMTIITKMKKDGNEWEDGEILDPNNGSTYDCKIWIEGGKLQVRGYIGFFFRTQTWHPTN